MINGSQHTLQSARSRQSGQVGIMIILIMIVLLTIGLSLASQSTKEIFLSSQEDQSTRVFNAAEAGVEQALSTDLTVESENTITGTATITGSNATVNYSIQKLTSLETRVPQGGVAMVKVADPGTAPAVTAVMLDWAKETACNQTPALLVLEIFSYDETSNPKTTVRYQTISPCDYSDGNTVISAAGSNGYFRTYSVPVSTTDTLIRLKPYYNDTFVKVAGVGGNLPIQSYLIQSTAANQQGSGTSTETRSVEVNRTLSMAPSIMDYVLFSGSTLIK
jgi:hypothetical protein